MKTRWRKTAKLTVSRAALPQAPKAYFQTACGRQLPTQSQDMSTWPCRLAGNLPRFAGGDPPSGRGRRADGRPWTVRRFDVWLRNLPSRRAVSPPTLCSWSNSGERGHNRPKQEIATLRSRTSVVRGHPSPGLAAQAGRHAGCCSLRRAVGLFFACLFPQLLCRLHRPPTSTASTTNRRLHVREHQLWVGPLFGTPRQAASHSTHNTPERQGLYRRRNVAWRLVASPIPSTEKEYFDLRRRTCAQRAKAPRNPITMIRLGR